MIDRQRAKAQVTIAKKANVKCREKQFKDGSKPQPFTIKGHCNYLRGLCWNIFYIAGMIHGLGSAPNKPSIVL